MIHSFFLACYDDTATQPEVPPQAPPQASQPQAPPQAPPQTQPPTPQTPPQSPPKTEPVFTQEDIQRIREEEKRKNQEKYNQLELSYQELLQNQHLSEEERTRIAKSYEDLQKQYRTKEQQLAEDMKQAQEQAQKRIKELEQDGHFWKEKYTRSTIDTALQAAAVAHDAYNPEQIIIQLRDKTKLVEQLDGDKPNGKFDPMVDMVVPNEDTGKLEVLQMTPSQAVEYMKKNPEAHGNLFKSGVREGIGSGNGADIMSGDGTVDPTKMSDEEYFALREKNPKALGLPGKSAGKWD